MEQAGYIVLGGVLVILGNIVVQWMSYKLTRAQRRSDRRDDFQHQTLIELQDEALTLIRAAGILYEEKLVFLEEATVEGLQEVRTTERYRQNLTRFWDAFFRLEELSHRVVDAPLRAELEPLLSHGRRMVTAPPQWLRDAPRDVFEDLTHAHEKAAQQLGVLLRKL